MDCRVMCQLTEKIETCQQTSGTISLLPIEVKMHQLHIFWYLHFYSCMRTGLIAQQKEALVTETVMKRNAGTNIYKLKLGKAFCGVYNW